MQISLAKSAGFCFGVKRAIDIALKTAGPGKNVYMLGDIVHNEDVVKQISAAGIRKVKRLARGKNKILLVRAHGISLPMLKRAQKLGYHIVDATCLMVKEIHRIACSKERRGYTIIVIGDKSHDEVLGITGQLKNKALIIDNVKNSPWPEIKKIKKACIVVQSTQNIEKVEKIVEILKPHIREVSFFNTICRPTRIKQKEIRIMPKQNDLMVVIGSKNSANTRRLYEISKSLNKHTFWVQSKKEIKPRWFKGKNTVGITTGASTPDYTTREIIDYISRLGKTS
jgi:4-hydroxy-3-methylbut-2-enyl diphosphate reductase